LGLLLLALHGCASEEDVQGLETEGEGKADGIVGSFGPSIDYEKPTHIIAIGYSHGQGTQFVHAATTRARRYRELYPDDQIVFFASPEVGTMSDAQALRSVGITVLSSETLDELSGPRLLESMDRFKSIKSFDFYGHSSPWGLGLESGKDRLGTNTSAALMGKVADNFTPDAYATLNGCNAGWYAGPYFSKAWRIPVLAALTGSNFERPFSDEHWYVNDEGRYPSSGSFATVNTVSFETPIACSKGACYRLKPENAPYRGYWGNFEAGLGFYKTFCNYDGSVADCARRAARAMLSYPSEFPVDKDALPEEFARVVFDALCPTSLDLGRREACRQSIKRAVQDRTNAYSPFSGTTVDCGLGGCAFSMTCSYDNAGAPRPGTCKVTSTATPSPKTYVEEYLLLMDGFAYLTGREALPPTSGVIDTSTLRSVDRYRVHASALNCRKGAGTEHEIVTVLKKGQSLWALPDSPSSPRIVTASTGKPWLRVTRGQNEPACFVSASYELLVPVKGHLP